MKCLFAIDAIAAVYGAVSPRFENGSCASDRPGPPTGCAAATGVAQRRFKRPISREFLALDGDQAFGSSADLTPDESWLIGWKKVADGGRDLRSVGFKREMPGVKKADDRIRDVPFERLRARRQEERVVLAPNREEGRLVGPEIRLEGRVERDVALVVAEQVELDIRRLRFG